MVTPPAGVIFHYVRSLYTPDMSTRNVTITSKNQITLPVDYARALNLSKSRVLRAEVRENKIVLSPQPALDETMRQFWGKHKAKYVLSDDDIQQAVRDVSAKQAANLL